MSHADTISVTAVLSPTLASHSCPSERATSCHDGGFTATIQFLLQALMLVEALLPSLQHVHR